MLKFDIGGERLAEAADEEAHHVLWREAVTAGQEGKEVTLVVLHRPSPLQRLDLIDGVEVERWPEAEVDELDEARPRNKAEVALHLLVPISSGAVQVQVRHPHLSSMVWWPRK